MMRFDRITLGRQAKELGFVRDTFEKVCRLADVLSFMESDGLLADSLALKGGTAINLSLRSEGQTEAFTAELTTWQTTAAETQTAPNALVLTAASEAQTNVWHFGGEAYKLLYNSGVEYLVFASGEYIAVIPTDGFTGGTQYGKLKAGGVSTRKFEYTLIQDETLRETTLSVQVEGETYLLEESTESPMYRYNVLIGTKDMMKKPYESYQPGKEAT